MYVFQTFISTTNLTRNFSSGNSHSAEMSDYCGCHSLCVVYISRLTKICSSLGRFLQILTAPLLYSRPLSASPLLSTSLADSSHLPSRIILSLYLPLCLRPFSQELVCASLRSSVSISSSYAVQIHRSRFPFHEPMTPPPPSLSITLILAVAALTLLPHHPSPLQDGAIMFLHHLSSSFSLSAVIIRSSARIRRLNPANSASGSCEVEVDLCKPSRIRGSTSLASCSLSWRKLTGSGLML